MGPSVSAFSRWDTHAQGCRWTWVNGAAARSDPPDRGQGSGRVRPHSAPPTTNRISILEPTQLIPGTLVRKRSLVLQHCMSGLGSKQVSNIPISWPCCTVSPESMTRWDHQLTRHQLPESMREKARDRVWVCVCGGGGVGVLGEYYLFFPLPDSFSKTLSLSLFFFFKYQIKGKCHEA